MKIKRKKRKLKKSVLFLLSFALIVIVTGSYFLLKESKIFGKEKEHKPKIDYISSILVNCPECSFERSFLEWIEETYQDNVLEQIDTALKDNEYQDNLWHTLTGNSYSVLQDLYFERYQDMKNVTIIDGAKDSVEIGYAGDVSLANNWDIMPHYNKNGNKVLDILSNDLVDYMTNKDWMIVNSEFAFSDRGSAMTGKLYTFRGHPDNVSIYKEMGVDMVTLANNHVYDYGKDAFLDTLTTLKNASIPYIGAGSNIEEATNAYYLIINGYKIAFLNATRAEKYIMTPEAKENSEGVFRCYDPSLLAVRIKEEKQSSDYVVALVHWGTENSHALENVQKETGRLYIDSGADMVIGSHAHVLQGVEFYNGKLIAYNLGNFIFNDYTIDTGILSWRLNKDGSSTFYFLPALQKQCYTSVLKDDNAKTLYDKMTSWSINATFLEDGQIVQK